MLFDDIVGMQWHTAIDEGAMHDDDRHIVLCAFRCARVFIVDVVPLVVDWRCGHL